MEAPAAQKFQLAPAVKEALLEAGFVVLGVVLAFAVNEWREARHDRARAESARATIVDELRANREKVAASLEYHAGRLEALQALGPDERPSPQLYPRGFVSPASVLSTAWHAASETGVLGLLPYEEVLLLSGVYAEQDRYVAQATSVGEVIYRELLASGSYGLAANRNLASILAAFRYREGELLRTYDEAFADLESETEQNS